MIRIIAGAWRGRRLQVPDGLDIRPTTEPMRARIFSMLTHPRYKALSDAYVGDFYAGTGALGLEALSRGAKHCIFIEKNTKSLKYLKANIQHLGAKDQTSIQQSDAQSPGPALKALDFIFMDPPYGEELLEPSLKAVLEYGWLAEEGLIIAEHARGQAPIIPDALKIIDSRAQGKQQISFLMRA